jgi:superfamily II DNA or RNA helicase
MENSQTVVPGQRVFHSEFGQGVVISVATAGYIKVFFGEGERQVHLDSVELNNRPETKLLVRVSGNNQSIQENLLRIESFALPLMTESPALTSAKVDLLPHQVVLTHKVALSSPRRFLVADEVGLGKTIETALILRELESRGALTRALMVVPAGLVNNWHRELNEVFNLNFEVFGSEGDVIDRKSNSFIKHNRLIASIDTLKKAARIKKLLDAPKWDLVVFDEAHHLTCAQQGNKTRKTENYKLAEALRNHSRDLILLSATPHQGEHFRFWKLIQLLDSTLFNSANDMVENRHRLNAVVIRRTKADACKSDGSPLFARRDVHTESFTMSQIERDCYTQICRYLEDGFNLAKKSGQKGNSLGFIMAVFQKIAASSFAAIFATLRKRLIALTLHEAIIEDSRLNISRRQELLREAREMVRFHERLGHDQSSEALIEKYIAELKFKILKSLEFVEPEDSQFEVYSEANEDNAALNINVALPEERFRLQELLSWQIQIKETKVDKLLHALGCLWNENPNEKIVIFATYLKSVELIASEIENVFPSKKVVVLRGGDHGSKLAAERKFKDPDGPKIMVCTAAGREGINLQFARILFNFDLPWNPMDIEQRIGRIHRYGQQSTAQVYNLVLSDTIEGKIFLLLDEKLQQIAKALGKVDAEGRIAEDLKAQVLGQLSERIRYDKLYQEALGDPELKRTKVELEAALENASTARVVVSELFQDLDRFSIDDYQPYADVSQAQQKLVDFLKASAKFTNSSFEEIENEVFKVAGPASGDSECLTTNRSKALTNKNLDLLGLDHRYVKGQIDYFQNSVGAANGIVVKSNLIALGSFAYLSSWYIEAHSDRSERSRLVVNIACSEKGERLNFIEQEYHRFLNGEGGESSLTAQDRINILQKNLEPMLTRELIQRGVKSDGGFSSKLISWAEIVGIGLN